MTILELILLLQKLENRYGNINVCFYDEDRDGYLIQETLDYRCVKYDKENNCIVIG